MSVEEALMNPQWRAVKKLIDKVHLNLDKFDAPSADRIGEDELSFSDIDTDTRKEMLKRQKAKMLIKLDEEKSAGGTTRAAKRARSAVSACSTPPVPVAAILPMAYAEPIVHVLCVAVPEGEWEGEVVRCVIAQPLEVDV